MKIRIVLTLLVFAATAAGSVIRDVRSAIKQDDFAQAERHIADYRAASGVTPEMLEALSWLGRGALAARQLDEADAYAAETRKLSLGLLERRDLDQEKRLPIALGASIEVQAQVLANRGALSEAIAFLTEQLERWYKTSIRTRIQKNIHLLSLEGKPAPPLDLSEYLGAKPTALSDMKGKALLLYFWAHWCPDCRRQAPVLAKLQAEFGDKGLVVIGPTQRYGFTSRGRKASPAEELDYIDRIRGDHYSALPEMPVPVSKENFNSYGSSTSPTLVLTDRQGIVRLYHPGRMSYDELAPKVAAVVEVID